MNFQIEYLILTYLLLKVNKSDDNARFIFTLDFYGVSFYLQSAKKGKNGKNAKDENIGKNEKRFQALS